MNCKAQPQTPLESFYAFRSAITWTEPFILCIIAFHIVMFLITIYVSRYNQNLTPRLLVLVCIAFIVRTSEYTNDYARRHWQSFSTQNYFDHHGLFMSIMICGPLLINSFIMLCFFLKEASQLLILVKKVQLQKQKQKQSKGTQSNKTSEIGTTTAKDDDTKKEQ
jgi:transmembrane protein 18